MRKGCRTIGIAGLLCSLLLSAPLRAANLSDTLSLNGFFSVDASVSRGGDSSFPGTTSLLDLKQDEVNYDNSVVGLQLGQDLTPNLRLTLQGVAGKDNNGKVTPSFEWAYLSYDMGSDLHLRAGQFKPPFLQGTELRNVGYSRIWVRPLVPTNGTGGFTSYRGTEFIKQAAVGDYNLSVQGGAGIAEHNQNSVDNHDIEILAARLEKDESWVKLSAFHARSDYYKLNTTTLTAADAASRGSSVEAELLSGANQFDLGYIDVSNDQGPNEQMKYLSWGYRLGRFTPYLLYQYQTRVFPTLPPPLVPPPPGTTPPPHGTEATNAYSLGVRYDLGEHYAIKAQAESINRTQTGSVANDTTVYTLMFEGAF